MKWHENIVGALGELGFREIGVQERPGLVVLRKTRMPALLIETGFINSDDDNQLYDEKKQEEIAQLLQVRDPRVLWISRWAKNLFYYRVQTRDFSEKEKMQTVCCMAFRDKGYPAYILEDGDFYKVQVGAFVELGNGIRMEQQLRDDGYSTLIVTR